jgi:hypothetical protein
LWYNHLKTILLKYNFIAFPYDEAVFINKNEGIIIACHVDDFIITGPNNSKKTPTLFPIYQKLDLVSLEELFTFLGKEININRS